MTNRLIPFLLFGLLFWNACTEPQPTAAETPATTAEMVPFNFETRTITDSVKFMWAFCPAEVSGDELIDLVLINGNNAGGPLQYLKGQTDTGRWELITIAEVPPTGGKFAAGDLEAADMDGDGDTDVFAVKHPGEWMDASAEAELFWYENPTWTPHPIGAVPNAVKDVNFADFDQDGKMDVAVLTFEESTLSVFRQRPRDGLFERVAYYENYGNLHEGMATGDTNGDGRPDIIANGYVFSNTADDLSTEWTVTNIDEKWNNQPSEEGRDDNWSRNGTKHFARDLDGDGTVEVFVSHSERAGYPLSLYRKRGDAWEEQIIAENIPAGHTLQVFDFDNDGDLDLLSGVNRNRAVNIKEGVDNYNVVIYRNNGDGTEWTPEIIGTDGIYNGQAADFDNDGDVDIFRYPNHEATQVELLVNGVK